MRANYNPELAWSGIGVRQGIYSAQGVEMVAAYCRGNLSQIDRILADTPFVPADDRFVVSISNFGGDGAGYWDGSLIFSVRYGNLTGGYYHLCHENSSVAVASGRELWGYKKVFAEFSVTSGQDAYHGEVHLKGKTLFELDFSPDPSVDSSQWDDLKTYPHLMLRGVPDAVNWGFEKLEVLTRDTSPSLVVTNREVGRAGVRFMDDLFVNKERLEIRETLGGERRICDFASTEETGRCQVVADLLK